MSDFGVNPEGIDAALSSLTRQLAAVMADPTTKAPEKRPATLGRRMAEVTVVNLGPPLTADVLLNGTTIPGASPQSTYRPQVGDLVWLEFLGTDAHISPPLTSDLNRKWNALTLVPAWVEYTAGGAVVPPGYWRDAQGIVHLRGTVAAGANGTIVAVLPAGYRPPITFSGHPVYAFAGGVPVAAVVAVSADGSILYYGPGAPQAVALDSIHFRID